jgi:hypothetical protein
MASAAINPRQEAHELIDSLAPGQVSEVVGLLKAMINPLTDRLANVDFEDERIGNAEMLAVERSKSWLKTNKPIPNEEVLAEFGLSSEDFERMGREPLEPCSSKS